MVTETKYAVRRTEPLAMNPAFKELRNWLEGLARGNFAFLSRLYESGIYKVFQINLKSLCASVEVGLYLIFHFFLMYRPQ